MCSYLLEIHARIFIDEMTRCLESSSKYTGGRSGYMEQDWPRMINVGLGDSSMGINLGNI